MPEVTVALYNRKTCFFPPYPKNIIGEMLSFQPNGYWFSPKYRHGYWDGWVRYLKRDVCPSGCFHDYQKEFTKAGLVFSISDHRVLPEFWPEESYEYRKFLAQLEKLGKPIRAHQTDCVRAMIESSGNGGIILASTGSGKTITAGCFFSRLKGSACFVVDELTLLDQARKAFAQILPEEIGIVGDSQFNPRRITVATTQTLGIQRERLDFKNWLDSIDVFVIDELHVQMSRRNFEVIDQAQPKAVYGLTATLERHKKAIRLKASSLCGPLIFTYSLEQGTQDGHLTPGVLTAVLFPNRGCPEMDHPAKEIDYAITRNKKRNDVIEALAREGLRRNLPTVILADRIQHLHFLSRRLKDIPHMEVWGGVPREDRDRAKREFDSGKIKLLIASRVFAKGVDIANIKVIIDATAVKSANSAGQKFGRGTRLAKNKKGLLYFDIADITPKGDRDRSGFHKNFLNRWEAYGRLKIPKQKVAWNRGPGEIFDRTVKKLGEIVS